VAPRLRDPKRGRSLKLFRGPKEGANFGPKSWEGKC
jgi:hypothetical protein